MTHRVGTKGQVVIPKSIRDALDLRAGDEVEFVLGEKGVRVEPARANRRLRGLLAGYDLSATLEADRRTEPK